ncbi:protein INVOLVED IN DE NOVO 2 [Dorcoceras hygrometricum]|uniref:Protein INVOLVED IN DE NOVO 2 n=1 Tax=Dorcoceras hygrometricum TaxID=472368 RepID=A0A2Z7DEU9_9LAMI|nr:protein INVOLVED IN DE NOVO 2 [Dorcoceras hygrometricum]
MFLVDWAVKMGIRPPEFETSICDAKYHVSLIDIKRMGELDSKSFHEAVKKMRS